MTDEPCGTNRFGLNLQALAAEPRRRLWAGGWRRWTFPGLWLVYLAQTAGGVSRHSSGAWAVVGYVIVAAFAATYLLAIGAGWAQQDAWFYGLYLGGFALTAAEAFLARTDAFVFFIYLGVLTVAGLRRYAAPIVAAMAAITLIVPAVAPGWGGPDYTDALVIVLVAFAMYAFFAVLQSNAELATARAEVARLAAENERTRIARDLHDLLGHSLTTITVKAGLARRLAERGQHDRAGTEIAEVEQLSRRTLADVRAAVAGHRDVTVTGELATAREVLRAAGIEAELPGSVDVVDPTRSELFGWVLREAVTNVVRHARATTCTVRLGRTWIEVADDGRGSTAGAGNGLAGLRERVAAAGGTVLVGPARPGWRVRVDVPDRAGDAAGHDGGPDAAAEAGVPAVR